MDYNSEMQEYERLAAMPEVQEAFSQDAAWEPLPSAPVAPGFDPEWLPPVLAEFAGSVAQNLSVPMDLPALVGLGAASACACGCAKVAIRPDWEEPCQLFLLVVMGSGEGKSPTFSRMTKPLFEKQAEENQRRQVQIAKDAAMVDTLAAKKAQAVKKGKVEEAQALAQEIAETPVMHPMRRFVGGDVTPEAIPEVMAENGGSTSILDDEGELLELLSGRYQERPNLDPLLKGYTGSVLSITRRGRSVVVNHPALSVTLLAQPYILKTLLNDDRMSGKGLLARFLIAEPEPLREYPEDEPAVPESLAQKYNAMLSRMMHMEPKLLHLSPEAKDVFFGFRSEWRRRQWEDWEALKTGDFIGKLAANTARLAGLLHLMEDSGDEISAGTMRRAIEIMRYFIGHTLRLLDDGCKLSKPAQEVLQLLLKNAAPIQKERELKRRLQQRKAFPNSEAVDAAFAELEQHGYIRKQKEKGAGHTAAIILLHPELLKAQEGRERFI